MLSKLKSIGLSVITNAYMVTFGLMMYFFTQNIVKETIPIQLLLFQTILLIKNYSLIKIIDFGLKNKENISEQKPKEEYKYEFLLNMLQATFIENITILTIQHQYFTFPITNFNLLTEFIWFIPLSFIFEIIFDFFHYWTHRMAHLNFIYKYLHKKHHKFAHPSTITTFYQDPIDLLLTNSLPVILTLCIIPKLTFFQFTMILLYKTYIELSGHCGKKLYPVSSFLQFIWFPKLFGIELYAEDHDIHHSVNNCNYSKRFSLWDKMFGTFHKIKYI